jgi:hypothetical protein
VLARQHKPENARFAEKYRHSGRRLPRQGCKSRLICLRRTGNSAAISNELDPLAKSYKMKYSFGLRISRRLLALAE